MIGPNDNVNKLELEDDCNVVLNESDIVNTTKYLLLVSTLIISGLPVEFIFLVHEKSGDISSIVQVAFSVVFIIRSEQNPSDSLQIKTYD